MAKYCIIVDAYSAGNLLAPEFHKRGVGCIHVQSTPEIWPIFVPSFRPSDFDHHFNYENDLPSLAQALREIQRDHELICVLAGTETGVELADHLSELLELPGNGTNRSAARRNKFLMTEVCRQAGLPVARQCKAGRVSEFLKWYGEVGIKKVVLKPLESAGTDHVFICESANDVERAAKSILGTQNMLGIWNQEALIQEYLEGTEYFLDTVSINGLHHFTDIWRYQKRSINGSNCVYDMNVLCSSVGDKEMALQDYVRKVLNALQVRMGPAHTEVMLGADGPKLVEVGTRLDGLSVPTLNQAAVGYSPVELTADVYLDQQSFIKIASRPYPIIKHARTIYFTSYEDGIIKAVPGEAKVRALESFFQMRLRVSPGSKITKTTNYFTAPGFVSLVHQDPKILDRDYALIRSWEKDPGGFWCSEKN